MPDKVILYPPRKRPSLVAGLDAHGHVTKAYAHVIAAGALAPVEAQADLDAATAALERAITALRADRQVTP